MILLLKFENHCSKWFCHNRGGCLRTWKSLSLWHLHPRHHPAEISSLTSRGHSSVPLDMSIILSELSFILTSLAAVHFPLLFSPLDLWPISCNHSSFTDSPRGCTRQEPYKISQTWWWGKKGTREKHIEWGQETASSFRPSCVLIIK